MTILIFLLVITFLVFIHELGHFWAARKVGVRVDKFSVGFPPRLISKKIGETEYMLSLLPIGGYVKLYGQSYDEENPSQKNNYASKSFAQRAFILVMGPLANILLAAVLMSIFHMMGSPVSKYQLEPAIIGSITPDSAAERSGLKAGDLISAINDTQIDDWRTAYEQSISDNSELSLSIVRNNQALNLNVPVQSSLSLDELGINPYIETIIGDFPATSPAKDAGLEVGDRIVSIAGQPINNWLELPEIVNNLDGNAAEVVAIRRNEQFYTTITPQYNEDTQRWLIGVQIPTEIVSNTPLTAVYKGITHLGELTTITFSYLYKLITGNASIDNLGGPIRIGATIGDAAQSGLRYLLAITAFISLQLGIFNLLPIPPLDGGHLALSVPELFLKKPLSVKVRIALQSTGVFLLLGLMIFVTINDLSQLI